MNELALFAGAGGGILGGHLLGWRTVCAVEWEPYAACILAARQNDGLLPSFPIWDDVQTFDGRPWRGIVDVISGGFPCQDISAAGKGAGIDGERSGMWREMARIIHEVRPKFVFVENSPMLTSRGLGTVLGDLAAMGFDAQWGVLGAADVGAPHQRDRIWIVANSKSIRYWERRKSKDILEENGRQDGQMRSVISGSSERSKDLANPNHARTERREQQSEGFEQTTIANPNSINDALRRNSQNNAEPMARRRVYIGGSVSNSGPRCEKGSRKSCNVADTSEIGFSSPQTEQGLERGLGLTVGSLASRWWDREPGETPRTVERGLGRVANGVAARVDRLKAIGNGQVPLVAATAWKDLGDQG
jgi:DNA (cytosine-5)-methyltransferase 1